MRMQTFVDALMRKLAALGITVPQRQQPPIHYHQPNQPVGEELDRAVQSAHEHFGERPNLIFVLMKKSSACPLHLSCSWTCRHSFCAACLLQPWREACLQCSVDALLCTGDPVRY